MRGRTHSSAPAQTAAAPIQSDVAPGQRCATIGANPADSDQQATRQLCHPDPPGAGAVAQLAGRADIAGAQRRGVSSAAGQISASRQIALPACGFATQLSTASGINAVMSSPCTSGCDAAKLMQTLDIGCDGASRQARAWRHDCAKPEMTHGRPLMEAFSAMQCRSGRMRRVACGRPEATLGRRHRCSVAAVPTPPAPRSPPACRRPAGLCR